MFNHDRLSSEILTVFDSFVFRALPRIPNRFNVDLNPDAPEAIEFLEEEHHDRKRRDVGDGPIVSVLVLITPAGSPPHRV